MFVVHENWLAKIMMVSCSVAVITVDFESTNLGSNPGRRIRYVFVHFWTMRGMSLVKRGEMKFVNSL